MVQMTLKTHQLSFSVQFSKQKTAFCTVLFFHIILIFVNLNENLSQSRSVNSFYYLILYKHLYQKYMQKPHKQRSLSDEDDSSDSQNQIQQHNEKKEYQIKKEADQAEEKHQHKNQHSHQYQQHQQLQQSHCQNVQFNKAKSQKQINKAAETSAQTLKRIKNQFGVSIFCGICEDYIVHTVTTFCQHSFCELCLTQYFLYLDECPECALRIRHQRVSSNILLDNIILDYLRKFQADELQSFNQRMEQLKQYQKDRRLTQFDAGTQVDIRDTDYIWGTGRIIRTINKIQDKKIKCMIVKYDRSSKRQQIPQNSLRIAPYGFYCKRTDIPKYHRGKLILENKEDNVIYTVPNFLDQEEEKEHL